MQDKQQIVEDILARFYENRVTKVSEQGKKVDVKLVTLDDRLEKNINVILDKLNYKVSRQEVANEQIYSMYNVLMAERFNSKQLMKLSDTEILNITIKHLKFNDYKLLGREMKNSWNQQTKSMENKYLKTTSLDNLILNSEIDLEDYSLEEETKLSDFRQWLNINKYLLLTDKQIYFLHHTGSLLTDLNRVNYSKAPDEYKENIYNQSTRYYERIKLKITAAYEQHNKNIKEQPKLNNIDTHFKAYIDLYDSKKYLECLDLLAEVIKSSDIQINEKIIVKNKYEKIESYLSEELELRYMQQILKYSKTKSANDVKQSTLVEVYKLLQKGL